MSESVLLSRIKHGEFTLMAEIGVNYYDIAEKLHIPLLDAAKYMILEAKNAGIHAVKFQTYKAETLASRFSPSYWDTSEEPTTSQYELFKKFDSFGEKEYQELSDFSSSISIEFCSTPFDYESADYLDSMMQVYKISSSDLTNLPFIRYIALKEKPILLSTGASDLEEIQRAVRVIRSVNHQELVLLHCVLEYPTPYAHANLAKILQLEKEFPDAYIGYSDHTKPDACYDVIKMAYLYGARLIEKHFTTDKKLQGNDHYHAMDGHDAKKILEAISFLDTLKGEGTLACLDSEQVARKNARRSLVAAKAIARGTVLTKEMLVCKRPGTGISPQEMENVAGCKAAVDIPADKTLTWEMIERKKQ